jgi:two-component system phosphate regulon sensor histidine kinase PhoR
VVVLAGNRLDDRLAQETCRELGREARVVGIEWRPGVNADSLADAAGSALGRRVTLIDPGGVVRGDSEFDDDALHNLQNHSTRPEVVEAKRIGSGCSTRRSPSAGDDEIYVAVRIPIGYARVSESTAKFREIVGGARRDVMIGGLIALVGALVIAFGFSRSVSRPIAELRDVAQAIAAGDIERRPTLAAPGEVGDLAVALHRMTEQLATRMNALEAEDALLNAVIDSLDEGIAAFNGRAEVIRLNGSARRLLGVEAKVPSPSTCCRASDSFATPFAAPWPARPPTRRSCRSASVRSSSRLGPFPTAAPCSRSWTSRRGGVSRQSDATSWRNVSHELKTPLTVIGGFAETLRDHDLPDAERTRFLETIESNTRRMQRIVDDLLDLSRYESGAWVPNVTSNDLAGIVTDIFTGVSRAAEEKGLALSFQAAPEARRVDADPTALRQILANLVENAVRHTARGAVTVSAEAPANGGSTIRVSDTGTGIPVEHLGRIFERFYRVDSGRARGEGGTGLGLAIVRHLVEAHGGSVRAESIVGQGTTITVHFPRKSGG